MLLAHRRLAPAAAGRAIVAVPTLLRHCRAVQRASSSTPGAVTEEDAERFEKIAAALVEKLKDLPDDELEPAGVQQRPT